jgi:LEA14-like dessication related protein
MNKGWIIALMLLLVGCIGAYVWYSRLKNEAESETGAYNGTLKPRVELSRFDITDISDDNVSMNMNLLIDNPLPVSFKASKVNYLVYINGKEVLRDSYAKAIALKSKDSTLLVLPIRLKAQKMLAVLKDLENRGVDSTNYRVHTTFDLDVPILGERTFTIDQTRRLPTFFIPKVTVTDIDFGKLSLKAMDVAAKVNIINKNKVPFSITDTHYSITIDGKQIAEGDQKAPILIRKQATTPVVFPTMVKPGQALGLLPKALFDKKDTPFEISFRGKLIDKNKDPLFQHSKFSTTIRGTLLDLKKLK